MSESASLPHGVIPYPLGHVYLQSGENGMYPSTADQSWQKSCRDCLSWSMAVEYPRTACHGKTG